MQSEKLKQAINDFNNLKQVVELLEICLKGKSKINYNLDIFEEPSAATASDSTNIMIKKVTISLDIEKAQGYSGYRQTYIL